MTDEKQQIQIRMSLTGNGAVLGEMPSYEVTGAGAYTSFFIQRKKIGYVVKEFARNSRPSSSRLTGFALTVRGADKTAYDSAKKYAQRTADREGAIVVDRRSEDLENLLSASEWGGEAKDLNGEFVKNRFYQ